MPGAIFFMKRLILIRHGDTDYTVVRRYCGSGDIPLNTAGINQAERLSNALKGEKIDRVYSSSLKRAIHTAEIAFKEKKIIIKDGLREIDFGKFYGLTFDQASKIYPEAYRLWLKNPLDMVFPGGEKIRDFKDRITKCYKEIVQESTENNIAIVAHGGVTRVIILHILNLSFDKFWETEQDVTALNIFDFKEGIVNPVKINDTSHLL